MTALSLRKPGSTKGSSTVLILLVLLMLVFLSVLAFVTTGSNLRLAKKNAETIQAWYRMDTIGEQTVSRLLQAIGWADGETAAFLGGNRFLDSGQQVLPAEVHQRVLAQWRVLETEQEREAFRQALYQPLNVLLCEQAVARLALEGVEILPADREALFTDPEELPATVFIIHAEDPEQKTTGTLEAVLLLLPASRENEQGHLQILEWKQTHAPFEYKNEIDVWEGIIE